MAATVSLISCGAIDIHWLPGAQEVDPDELQATLSAEDWTRAHEFKAERRRLEYLRSRYLVRLLTKSTAPIPADIHGCPSWPDNWAGSITHKDKSVGVALHDKSEWLSIGIDAEDPRRMRHEFAAKILTDEELTYLKAWSTETSVDLKLALTCCFSFKESIYKAHYPLGRKPFYFHDAAIEAIDINASSGASLRGTISARLLIDSSALTPAGSQVVGHFDTVHEADRYFILTTVGVGPPS